MKSSLERELKLEPPVDFELPQLEGRRLGTRLFTSTYYDTPTRSLARAGITLRRRLENGVSRWQLKLPRAENARTEIEALGGPSIPPNELLALLKLHLRHAKLEPVATLRTRRAGVRVGTAGQAVADVTLDAVDVLDGGSVTDRFSELEVELIDGDESDLKRLGRELRQAGAQRSDGKAKVMRVLQLDTEAEPKKSASPAKRTRYLLGQQLRALESYDPGVRLDVDPEDLHQFRVATRRARAVIRATKTLFGDQLEPLAAELKWLAGALGPVRDLDVLIEHLTEEVARLGDREEAQPLLDALGQERDAQRQTLAAALDTERYLQLPTLFAEALEALGGHQAKGRLEKLAAAEFRKLEKAAKQTPPDTTDEQLHALRIRAKRARYAAELAGGGRLSAYVEALKRVQDVIGEHQDAVVAEERIRSVSSSGHAVAERLIEAEQTRKLARRAEYPALLDDARRRGRKAFD